MNAPQDPLRTPENCGHQRIERFTGGDNAFSIWACGDCKLRFYPACPECVDVGHRNVVHPALPAEPQPPIDAPTGFLPGMTHGTGGNDLSNAGPLGHSHLWFCQCSDPSIPRHSCAAATEPADGLDVQPDNAYDGLYQESGLRAEPADGLDEAWKEAETALPKVWPTHRIDGGIDHWNATATVKPEWSAEGRTPAAALRALAARLRSEPVGPAPEEGA